MKSNRLVIASAFLLSLNTANPFFHKHEIKVPAITRHIEIGGTPSFAAVPSKLSASNIIKNQPIIADMAISTITPPHQPPQTDHKSEWAGYAAMLLSCGAFLFQLGRNWKVGKQKDISLAGWITSLAMDASFAIFGLAHGIVSITVSNMFALIPRAGGVYQIVRGHSRDFRSAISYFVRETRDLLGETMTTFGQSMNNWCWSFIGNPLDTLVAAATVPLYLQFQKTSHDLSTRGISLYSQAAYLLASIGWGINGLNLDKPAVVASSLAGLLLISKVIQFKLGEMKREGESVLGAWYDELGDSMRFVVAKAKQLAGATASLIGK